MYIMLAWIMNTNYKSIFTFSPYNQTYKGCHFLLLDSIKDFRLMTKKTGESKGCGFLEFDNQDSYWVIESQLLYYCTFIHYKPV